MVQESKAYFIDARRYFRGGSRYMGDRDTAKFYCLCTFSFCGSMGIWFSSAWYSSHSDIFIWSLLLCLHPRHLGQYSYPVLWSESRDHRLDVCSIIHDRMRHFLPRGYATKNFPISSLSSAHYPFFGIFPSMLRF